MIWPIRWTIYLAFLTQVVFLVLKIAGAIGWHWLIVLIPGLFLVVILALLARIMYLLQ